jgi:16S rRNA (cytosine1402-N4)-methyltransferase
MLRQNVISPVWFEPPAWLAIDPRVAEEGAEPTEDFVYHRPVLDTEALERLKPKAGLLILDATCGGGGHTEALLESGADVVALDQDPDAVRHVTERLAHLGRRIIVRQANFRHADCVLDELGIRTIGGALLDLGVSSRQLENAERGFSFIRNGPLDMRMDPRTILTAATIVNDYSEEELTRLFRELGEEPAARRIASMILKMRKTSPFRETLPLARTIEKLVGRHGRQHPATQVFQALRMEVNDELGALEQGLRVLTARLERGGRIAVITFHSLEDRIVKNFFRDHSKEWLDRPEWPEPRRNPDYDLALVTPEPPIAKREVARSGEDQMNRSRRRNCNTVNAASLARWIVMTVFLALAGLAYVYLTLQLYHLGERRKAVENELALLRTQNDVAAGQIAALTSRTTLQRRLKEGYLKMIPVSESKIVRLTVPARPTDEEAIQPVVNPLAQHESK